MAPNPDPASPWDTSRILDQRGRFAVVTGATGGIGGPVARELARAGATVTLIEPSEKRRAAARALARSAMIESDAVPDGTADLVVEATGNPHMLDAAVAWTRPEGRIVVASFYGKRRAPIDLGDAFHRRRLELRASQVSSIPPRLRERWTPARRWMFVLSLLHERALDALIAPPTPFESAAELYASLATDADVPPAHVFVYR